MKKKEMIKRLKKVQKLMHETSIDMINYSRGGDKNIYIEHGVELKGASMMIDDWIEGMGE